MIIKLKKVLKSKIIFIILLILLIIVALFILFSLIVSFSFKLNGKDSVTVNYNEKYIDKGTENLFDLNVHTESVVDTSKIGKYKIKYTIKILFLNIYKYRTVLVVDKKSPVITLNGDNEVVICPNTKYEEEGYSAIDEYDGDISGNVKITNSEDEITYEVKDSSGNLTNAFRRIKKEDVESPNISLNGNSNISIKVGSKYDDLGYTVSDNCDSSVNVSVDTNLNTNNPGKYFYKYIAEDSNGNRSEITREINVYKESGSGVIYLTFDDGPSSTGSTRKILNILKEEGVKATFFVTANGNLELVKDEYNEGHAIALHTNTHNYSYVYSSVDNYFADLTAIENKVYNLIGIKPKIIRFPGGSNNTVSNRYMQGIMNVLTKEVVNRGYNYFDWNVSSGDAGGCTTSSCVYNNTINGLSKSKNNVVLMHDIKMFTADALKDIINYGKANGYIFKVIDESTPPVRFKW